MGKGDDQMFTKFLTAGAGLAALAAAPAAAQYGYQPNGNGYGYYGNNYYNNANVTQMAVNQCNAAVQSRLNNRGGLQSILGAVLRTNTSARIFSVSSVNPNRNSIRVRGYASGGRYAYNPNGNYGAYGYGAYGAQGYGYANSVADLSFKCDVDYQGRVRDIDLNRRR